MYTNAHTQMHVHWTVLVCWSESSKNISPFCCCYVSLYALVLVTKYAPANAVSRSTFRSCLIFLRDNINFLSNIKTCDFPSIAFEASASSKDFGVMKNEPKKKLRKHYYPLILFHFYHWGIKFVASFYVNFYRYAELYFINLSVPANVF